MVLRTTLLTLLAASHPAFSCQCERFSTCNEVAATNLVFIGTVESIEPKFLSRWNETSQPSLRGMNEAYQQARQHPSPESLESLKDAYLRAFPDAPPDLKNQVLKARSAAGVAAVFYSSVGRGIRVRLHVETLFKDEEDDGDSKPVQAAPKGAQKDDLDDRRTPSANHAAKKPEAEFIDVWTPFGDCGVNFQMGETYLVYAASDEESSGSIMTDACTRTRRLSDAGDDLAYLYFYKNHPASSTRIDGYATTNARYRLDFNPLHPERVQPSVSGVPILITGDDVSRVVETDQNGHFVFDGLAGGDYTLTAYDSDYPRNARARSAPLPFHLAPRSCSLQVVVVSKPEGGAQIDGKH
ncbi:MAG TPA: carboxypeptidase-like regulatory domain-containing protein [Bryobacteraceae bacterium]|nr:carboxypeptidase-like regulatory domain-containing protein [Bryobacteraceae bacterium]